MNKWKKVRLCVQDTRLRSCWSLLLVMLVLSLLYKVSQCFDKRKRSKDWEMEHISSLVSLLLVWTGLSMAHNYLSDKVTFIIVLLLCTFTFLPSCKYRSMWTKWKCLPPVLGSWQVLKTLWSLETILLVTLVGRTWTVSTASRMSPSLSGLSLTDLATNIKDWKKPTIGEIENYLLPVQSDFSSYILEIWTWMKLCVPILFCC